VEKSIHASHTEILTPPTLLVAERRYPGLAFNSVVAVVFDLSSGMAESSAERIFTSSSQHQNPLANFSIDQFLQFIFTNAEILKRLACTGYSTG